MRASGWFLGVAVAFAIPLAIGIATGQSWTPAVTYAGWSAVTLAFIVRAIWPKHRPRATGRTIAGPGDVYNQLFMAWPRQDVTFGDSSVVAEEPGLASAQIDDGKVTLRLPPEH